MQKRLQWAKKHNNWTDDQWLHSVTDLHAPDCNQATVKNSDSVMIWSSMSADGIGCLHVIVGTLNDRKYMDTTLEPQLIPSIRNHSIRDTNKASFIFQQNLAPCHTEEISKQWFGTKNSEIFSWPGSNPDLNPIENLWHHLKIVVRMWHPTNKKEVIDNIK